MVIIAPNSPHADEPNPPSPSNSLSPSLGPALFERDLCYLLPFVEQYSRTPVMQAGSTVPLCCCVRMALPTTVCEAFLARHTGMYVVRTPQLPVILIAVATAMTVLSSYSMWGSISIQISADLLRLSIQDCRQSIKNPRCWTSLSIHLCPPD
jgi:hypothetical protein